MATSPVSPVNAVRGEVLVTLAGTPVRLCLTMGALAEIEGVLGAPGLSGLANGKTPLSAGTMIAVLTALVRGGGGEAAHLAVASQATPVEAAQAIAAALKAASGPVGSP